MFLRRRSSRPGGGRRGFAMSEIQHCRHQKAMCRMTCGCLTESADSALGQRPHEALGPIDDELRQPTQHGIGHVGKPHTADSKGISFPLPGGGPGLQGDAIELPTELMMCLGCVGSASRAHADARNLVGPGLAAVRAKPNPASHPACCRPVGAVSP